MGLCLLACIYEEGLLWRVNYWFELVTMIWLFVFAGGSEANQIQSNLPIRNQISYQEANRRFDRLFGRLRFIYVMTPL